MTYLVLPRLSSSSRGYLLSAMSRSASRVLIYLGSSLDESPLLEAILPRVVAPDAIASSIVMYLRGSRVSVARRKYGSSCSNPPG
jgi:hypothetical protein